jgi:hypothetical protein
MKTIISITLFIQLGIFAVSSLNVQAASIALSNTKAIPADNVASDLEPNSTADNRLRKKINSNRTVPFRAFLSTMDNKNVAVLVRDVTDSSILIVSKSRHTNPYLNEEINYSNIREIKIRRKNGIIKGLLYGLIAGAMPAVGGIIIGQAQGGGFVSMATLPTGIVTGGIIGASHKKYHINGNSASFSLFKTKVQ